ncbi:MAG: hypothetical protein EOP05_02505 [Proteobacteria bacterium]|nr:MAG: hypothetical protein EOP05_02505 [Pseudomonadota bacterium]
MDVEFRPPRHAIKEVHMFKVNLPDLGKSGLSIENHLETVITLLRKHLGPKVAELGESEEKLRNGAKMIYQFLPMPVRLVVSEEKFVLFIVEHKEPVISALKENPKEVDS